jgi:hypothetical protein
MPGTSGEGDFNARLLMPARFFVQPPERVQLRLQRLAGFLAWFDRPVPVCGVICSLCPLVIATRRTGAPPNP